MLVDISRRAFPQTLHILRELKWNITMVVAKYNVEGPTYKATCGLALCKSLFGAGEIALERGLGEIIQENI